VVERDEAPVTKPKKKKRKKRDTYLDPTQHVHGPRKRPVPHPTVLAKRRIAGRKAWEAAQEKRNAWYAANPGGTSRAGVPDGWRKADAIRATEEARVSAQETIKIMVEKNLLTDDEKANEALETAIALMRGPGLQYKLAAARTVLEYTKAKPASKQDISIQKAEDWLALVTADATKKD
jgi:hypothetical protein